MVSSLLQLKKHPTLTDVNSAGKSNVCKSIQKANAYSPILLSFEGNVNVESNSQCQNEYDPTVEILSVNSRLSNLVQCSNA